MKPPARANPNIVDSSSLQKPVRDEALDEAEQRRLAQMTVEPLMKKSEKGVTVKEPVWVELNKDYLAAKGNQEDPFLVILLVQRCETNTRPRNTSKAAGDTVEKVCSKPDKRKTPEHSKHSDALRDLFVEKWCWPTINDS